MYFFLQVTWIFFLFILKWKNTRKTKKLKNDDCLVFSSSFLLSHKINKQSMLKNYYCHNNSTSKYACFNLKILFFSYYINIKKQFNVETIICSSITFVQNSRFFLFLKFLVILFIFKFQDFPGFLSAWFNILQCGIIQSLKIVFQLRINHKYIRLLYTRNIRCQ